jgi:hypothetical protein
VYSCISYPPYKAHLFCAAIQLLSILANLSAHYISTLFHKRSRWPGGGGIYNTKCTFWFSLQIWSVFTFLEELSKHFCTCTQVLVDSTRYSCQLSSNLKLFDIISTNPLTSNFTKIHPKEAVFFRADREKVGLTDMMRLTFAFRNFGHKSHQCI